MNNVDEVIAGWMQRILARVEEVEAACDEYPEEVFPLGWHETVHDTCNSIGRIGPGHSELMLPWFEFRDACVWKEKDTGLVSIQHAIGARFADAAYSIKHEDAAHMLDLPRDALKLLAECGNAHAAAIYTLLSVLDYVEGKENETV